MTEAFNVLGEPIRRRILELLAGGERAAGELAEVLRPEFGISQPAVSQHLKVLRDHGLARVRADGTRRIYSLDPTSLDAVDAWLGQVRSFWTDRFEDLADEVARGRPRRLVAESEEGGALAGAGQPEPAGGAWIARAAIAQVSHGVRDLAKAEAWYRDVLGLRHLGTADGRASFDGGGMRLVLIQGGETPPGEGDRAAVPEPLGAEPILHFRVPDIDAAYRRLRSHGVSFRDGPRLVPEEGGAAEIWMATFDDPEGRLLAIVEPVGFLG